MKIFRPTQTRCKNSRVIFNFTRKERNHVLLSRSRISKTVAVNDPTGNNVAPGYKTPNQKKRISALQSQGVNDLLIEKV